MFVDPNRQNVWDKVRHRDFRAFAPWLTREIIAQAATRAGVALGGGPLCLFVLVWLAIACALHPTKSFAAVLGLALKLMGNDPTWDPNAFLGTDRSTPTAATKATARGKDNAKDRADAQRGARSNPGPTPPRSKHDPHGSGDPFRLSAAAFTQARAAMPWAFWVALVLILADRFEDQHADLIRFKHFRLLALDGTCLKLDRWADLVARAGTSENGKGLPTPQARLVLLQLPLVRLPVRFELFPYSVGERTVATAVLEALRRDDLVLIDRGFWSFGLFCQIGRSQADFAIRQMSGVVFKALKSLGTQDRLVRWTPSDRQWKDEGLPDSLRLRVIAYQIKGFRPSAVVTSVLDPTVISRDEFVRLATVDQAGRTLDAGLYHRRWEIETTAVGVEGHARDGWGLPEPDDRRDRLRGGGPPAVVFPGPAADRGGGVGRGGAAASAELQGSVGGCEGHAGIVAEGRRAAGSAGPLAPVVGSDRQPCDPVPSRPSLPATERHEGQGQGEGEEAITEQTRGRGRRPAQPEEQGSGQARTTKTAACYE